jgi:predicted DNA-binding transcriptional regulator AlpA
MADTNNTLPEPMCVTVPDAATLLAISQASVWRLIRADRLPVLRLQGRTLIQTDALRAMVSASLSTHHRLHRASG